MYFYRSWSISLQLPVWTSVWISDLHLKILYFWKFCYARQDSKGLHFTIYLQSIVSSDTNVHSAFFNNFQQRAFRKCAVLHKFILTVWTVCANNTFLFIRVNIFRIWLSCTFLLLLMWGIWGLLEFQPHSRKKIKGGAVEEEKKSQRIKNKSTGGSTSSLSEPRRLKGQWS